MWTGSERGGANGDLLARRLKGDLFTWGIGSGDGLRFEDFEQGDKIDIITGAGWQWSPCTGPAAGRGDNRSPGTVFEFTMTFDGACARQYLVCPHGAACAAMDRPRDQRPADPPG